MCADCNEVATVVCCPVSRGSSDPVERRIHNPEVVSANLTPAIDHCHRSFVAGGMVSRILLVGGRDQKVERRLVTRRQKVDMESHQGSVERE